MTTHRLTANEQRAALEAAGMTLTADWQPTSQGHRQVPPDVYYLVVHGVKANVAYIVGTWYAAGEQYVPAGTEARYSVSHGGWHASPVDDRREVADDGETLAEIGNDWNL